MNMIDFFIGFTLMNAMPHYVLGVWKADMLSGFGKGHARNRIWGICNFLVSLGLFFYKYGVEGLLLQPFYSGALLVLVTFFITSPFWYNYFYSDKKNR